MNLAFRFVSALSGVVGIAVGLVLFGAFFAYQRPGSEAPLPMGPLGYHFAALAGCALVGWGSALIAAARNLDVGRRLAPGTAFALVLVAVYRMVGWLVGDYHALAGDLLRVEAGACLALALAFIWLRPRAVPRVSF